MSTVPTTRKGDTLGRLMMLKRPLSPSPRCDELPHPRATVRADHGQWIVTVWEAPYVISDVDGAVKNFESRADALDWAALHVHTHRMAAGQIHHLKVVPRAAAA